MNVFNVILIAIGMPLAMTLGIVLPLAFAIKGRGAWKDIPREVYNQRPLRIFGIRPICIWIASAALGQMSSLFEWLKWPMAHDTTEAVSWVMFLVALISSLVWAIRIRADVSADGRMRHFARYAFWGSAAGLFLMAATCVSMFDRILHPV